MYLGHLPAALREPIRAPIDYFTIVVDQTRSSDVMLAHALPNGLTQKLLGSTGSFARSGLFSQPVTKQESERTCVLPRTYSQRDVPGNTILEPVFGKNAESESKTALQVCSCSIGIVKRWHA